MNQRNNKQLIWGLMIVFTILFFEILYAQSSENYQIVKSSITQGGAQSKSASYRAFDAIGQSAVICTTNSENYIIYSGILYGNESVFIEVDKSAGMSLPNKFELLQNYPNPFNPVTFIEYNLPQPADVELIIYDIQGHVVRRLVSGTKAAGYHTAVWDGKDYANNIVATGIYFYRIVVTNVQTEQQKSLDIKKMILMK